MTTRIESIVWGAAPEGAVVDKAILTIVGQLGTNVAVDVKMGETSVSVDLLPDVYVATIQAVDAANNPVGAPVSDTFTIAVPITYVIPVSMTGA
jgi:hypothetical protein